MTSVLGTLARHTDGRLEWVGYVAVAGAVAGYAAAAVVEVGMGWPITVPGTVLGPPVVFGIPAAVGGLVASPVCWWVVVERSGRAGPLRGAAAGGAAGVLAHPVMWVAFVLVVFGPALTPGGPVAAPSEVADGVVEGAAGFGILSLLSLLFFGWLTLAIGLVVGAVLGIRRARVAEGASE